VDYEQAGNLDKALEIAKEALAVSGFKDQANAELARLLRKAGRSEEAIPFQEEAVRLAKGDSQHQVLSLINLYVDVENYEKAATNLVVVFKQIAKSGDRFYGANQMKEVLDALAEHFPDFVQDVRRAADANPADHAAQVAAADICSARGMKEEAEEYQKRATASVAKKADDSPNDFDAQVTAARNAESRGQYPIAAAYYERAMAIRPDINLQRRLIHAYQNGKEHAKQVAALEAMIKQHPNTGRVTWRNWSPPIREPVKWRKPLRREGKRSKTSPTPAVKCAQPLCAPMRKRAGWTRRWRNSPRQPRIAEPAASTCPCWQTSW